MRWIQLVLLILIIPAVSSLSVGIEETVLIAGEPVTVRIDTGAEYSSIDSVLARELALEPTGRSVTVFGALGREEREIVTGTLTIGDRTSVTDFTIADRSELGTNALIGRRDLVGATVRVDSNSLTTPTPGIPIDRILLLIPILASLILLLRLVIGLRTYGVFGPVVIALSLIGGVTSGLAAYAILITVGIATALVLDRIPWPLIARIAFLLFVLAAASSLLDAFIVISAFPIIITAFLVEKFSESLQVHELREGLMVLIITLLSAGLLALIGEGLITLSQTAFLIATGIGLITTVVCASYTGLRISELWRFR